MPRSLPLLLLATVLLTAAPATAQETSADPPPPTETTAFTGATVWPGGEAEPVEDATLLVTDGRVAAVLPADEAVPENARVVDLSGRYVVPGLINAHGHVGVADGLETGPDVGSAELVREQLRRYAHYGVTTVVSLGGGPPAAFEVRDALRDAEGTAPGHARLFLSGPVVETGPVEEVLEQVRYQAGEQRADWTKIRVDDDLDRGEKMPPALYAAIAEASHAEGVPLAAHVVELADTKGVLRAGADLLAHSVRDTTVDDELIGLLREGDRCITPTLMREVSTYVYAERPAFFDDPFFLETADPEVLAELERPEVQAAYTGRAADYYRAALPVATGNMMRLHEAGIGVAMGTDSGQPARFSGYFEHAEMAMMQEAGMTPREVLRSATDVAAGCMGIGEDELGRLVPGAWADFVVLGDDPLEDVAHLREIEAVYVGGERVSGEPAE